MSESKPKVGNQLVYKSRAQAKYDRVAATNPAAAAEKLIELDPRHMSQDPQQRIHNMAEPLQELQGREVSVANIDAAIGRIQAPASRFDTRKRQTLYFGASKLTVNPRSHSATDDGKPFFTPSANEQPWRRKRREREEQE